MTDNQTTGNQTSKSFRQVTVFYGPIGSRKGVMLQEILPTTGSCVVIEEAGEEHYARWQVINELITDEVGPSTIAGRHCYA
jgi:hypothetical protein